MDGNASAKAVPGQFWGSAKRLSSLAVASYLWIKQSKLCALPQQTPASLKGAPWARCIWGLCVAFSLSVAFYVFAQRVAPGTPGDCTNYWNFTACTRANFHLDQLRDAWSGRVLGMLLSGVCFDAIVSDNAVTPEKYAAVFGLYHASFLFHWHPTGGKARA